MSLCWWIADGNMLPAQSFRRMRHIPLVFKLLGKGSPLTGRHKNGEHFILASFHDSPAQFWHYMTDSCFTAPKRIGE